MDRNGILDGIVYPAVAEFAPTLEAPERFASTPDCALFGCDDAVLDSLGLVTFLIVVEEGIEFGTGRSITLASEHAMSRESSPFQTLGSLADYIGELLAETVAG